MQVDLVVRGGTLVQPGLGVRQADIGIAGGCIVAIAAPGDTLRGREVIDARGRYLFPGIIDTHTHVGIGAGLKDLETETATAALGGVTSLMLFLREPTSYREVFVRAKQAGEDLAHIDFGFHAVMLLEEQLRELPMYAREFGIRSFKFYMSYRGDDVKFKTFDLVTASVGGLDDGFMYDVFRAVAREGALVMAHCENIELIQRLRKHLAEAGEDSISAWNASRPNLAEIEAVRRAMLFAEETGARLHILHTTTGGALEQVRQQRTRYNQVYVEVCPPYLLCDAESYSTAAGKMRPPLRSRNDVEALWRGVADGTVNSVATDHVPIKLAGKLGTVWVPTSGTPGTHLLLPSLLSEGYHRRGIPLERIAELICLNPARLYGLYPRKGAIEIGADADLTVVDLEQERVVHAADFPSHGDFSLFEGMTLKGWPTHTLVRGRIVMAEGQLQGASGWGRYQHR